MNVKAKSILDCWKFRKTKQPFPQEADRALELAEQANIENLMDNDDIAHNIMKMATKIIVNNETDLIDPFKSYLTDNLKMRY